MPVFESSIEVALSADAAYRLTQDYSRRLEWDPFLREARLLDGKTEVAPGVKAWCVSHSGLGMETEYVSAQPGKVAAVKMTRGPWLVARFAGSWLFQALGPDRTRVVFRYNVQARPRWLRGLLEPFMLRWFRRETAERLAALKASTERAKVP